METAVWTLDRASGLLQAAHFVPSPNCDERPSQTDISLLLVHGISLPAGCFGGDEISQLFCNRLDCESRDEFAELAGLRVSAHLLIRRDGSLLQFVPFHRRAWHAGESSWQGRSACNDFAVGVELEGCDDLPYEPVQYEALAGIARELMVNYPALTPERIVGHSDVAPGRKTDPGEAFDWGKLRRLISDSSGLDSSGSVER
ncbi:MAG: 1,6-anhydro-N-acetylmuramyl-L-alanine amidase AmpD [Gammaproteobacteria bacterium]|nr:1,6-anhydro-N-acetylmuramyl-L-alanine amidase AmpD [Gammaproteobacteria bacterium]